MAEIEIRRAADRFLSCAAGRESHYSFSYAEHYAAANTHHGLLLAHNDETLAPGAGYAAHPHRDLEIVTWVVVGNLTHRDSSGAPRIVPAGWVQVMSAASGVTHSETNEHAEPVRYLQMWVAPDGSRTAPSYDLHRLPMGNTSRPLTAPGQPGARFSVVQPDPGGVGLPDAAFLHPFVAVGTVDVTGAGRLAEGDAVRFAGAGDRRVSGQQGSLVGVWAMESALGG
jgi:quercetin 2,3-dioxygenase